MASAALRLRTAALVVVFLQAGQAQLSPEGRDRLRQAQTLISSGDFAQAEGLLDALVAEQPENGEAHYRLGLVLLRRGEIEGAGRHLEAAVDLTPGSPLVWLGAARVRLRQGKTAAAKEAAARADSLAPDHPAIGRALAMFSADAGDFAEAARYETRWIEANPQDGASALRLAQYLLEAGEAEDAAEAAERALASGDNAEGHYLLGRAARAVNDPKRASAEFQKAIDLEPNRPPYYLELARLFLDHRTVEPAVVVLERAAARFPEEPEVLRLLGLARYAAGEQQEAIDAFLKVTDLDPDSELGYASLETLLPHADQRLGEIVRRLRGFCERRPTAVGFHLLALALALEDPGSEEAVALLRRAIEIDASFWPAHFELHKSLLEGEDYEGAAAALGRTIDLNPDYAPAYFALSQVHARTGNRKRAAEERRIHHELLREQSEAAESRRKRMPRLPVQIGDY